MQKEHEIIKRVYAAKEDLSAADDLIRDYIPFIKKETSGFLSRPCDESDDEYSIALMAFHEAIGSYEKRKGAFLSYAALTVKSRLIDYSRKESRHRGHLSIYEEDENETPMHEKLADPDDHYAEGESLEATRQEIAELSEVLSSFGLVLSDAAENSPKQDRTLQACSKAVRYAIENPELLDELLRTKRLPLAALCEGAKVERKTLERHRKYIMVMLLIQTNGYEIIRGHIKHVLMLKGGVPA